MLIEVEIIDRIYHNIEDFCEANGFDVNEYVLNAIVERYNIDKYGDLNEKLVSKVEEKKKPKVKIEEKVPILDELPQEDKKDEIKEVIVTKEEDKKDITVLPETEKKEEKPKRTRRTLKTK